MRNDKTLKRLAEQHFFLGRKLTSNEYKLLKNSKYSDIVQMPVNSISESHTVDSTSTKHKSKRTEFYPFLNKEELKDLIDDVEMIFKIDISNPSPFKYKNVDRVKLKDFIRKYITTYFVDSDTLDHVTKIINRDDLSVNGILSKLYVAAGV